jgi:hypothetical protein
MEVADDGHADALLVELLDDVGTACAASSLFTVTRTSSEPARARAATCCTVPGMSAVSVLVMDCTTTGASEPTRTPPTRAVTVFLDQQQAGLEMAFAMILPIAAESMVAVLLGQGRVFD